MFHTCHRTNPLQTLGIAVVSLTLLLAGSARLHAAIITLDFEGLQDEEPINNFYDGGLGGFGSGPGPNYGISFTSDSLAIISSLSGGGGNFQNNPSGDTIAFFLTGAGDTMNVNGGFDTGFSFYYSAIVSPGSVNVYDGPNGTGNLLTTLALAVTPSDPNLPTGYNEWFPIGVSFAGTAESVVFTGTANYIGFDNVTLGSDVPTTPEPSSIVLCAMGLIGLVDFARRRQIGCRSVAAV